MGRGKCLVGTLFLLLCLEFSATKVQAAQVHRKIPPPASNAEAESDGEAEEPDEVEAFRLDQRRRLAQGVNSIRWWLFVPIIVGFILVLALFLTPSELYKIRPFDKSRDRKAPTVEDNGYKDSDFHW